MYQKFARSIVIAVSALSASTLLAVENPETTKIAEQVARDVRDLGDASTAKVDNAELHLLAGGAEEFKAIEAAAANPGLPKDAASKLQRIIGFMKPMQPARLKVAAARQALIDWSEKSYLAAYDSAGKKDPKWDAAVKTALSLYARDDGKSEATRAAVSQAIKLGCNDPFVQNVAANCIDLTPPIDYEAAQKLYQASSPGIQSSNYPPHMKFVADLDCAYHLGHFGEGPANVVGAGSLQPWQREAFMRAVHPKTPALATSLLHKALAIWPRVVKEPGIPPRILVNLARAYMDVVMYPEGDRKAAFDQIFPALSAAIPNDAATLRFQGTVYHDWAVDARGTGFANTVSKQNFDLFFERLAVAEAALSKAADLDDADARASSLMISVSLLRQEERPVIDRWFARAIKTDPDSTEAYRGKMMAVLPQWGGTPAEMGAWQKQCIGSSNWHARLPLIATEIYRLSTPVMPDHGAAMWKAPKTWETINFVYSAWLNAYPDDSVARSRWTYFACRCEQWDAAKKGFAALGDRAVESEFYGMLKADQAQAAQH